MIMDMKHQKPARVFLVLILVLSVAMLIPTVSYAAPNAAPISQTIRTPGKVMLLGGAMQDDNAVVYEALRAATGKANPRIAVLCSASPGYSDAYHEWYIDDPGSVSYQHLFQRYGFDPVFIPIALDTYPAESFNQANVDLINSSDAVFFNGGWQERHTRCMYLDDGSDTPVMAAVRKLYERGGVITGTSAGCAVQGSMTYGDGTSYGYLKANHLYKSEIWIVNTADPGNPDNGGFVKGLGFTSLYNALCDSHFEAQGRFARPLVAMRDLGATRAFGVDENTGFLLDGDVGTVYGAKGVTIFETSGASLASKSDPYFTASNVTVSYLTNGDRYTFSTKAVKSTITNQAAPTGKVYNSSKIFSPYEASKVMTALIRTNNTSATGSSAEKSPRFIVTFSKDSGTKGYYDSATAKVTVDKMKVKITIATTK